MICKENYKVVVIIKFLLHQNIVSKKFMINTLLNIRRLLKP